MSSLLSTKDGLPDRSNLPRFPNSCCNDRQGGWMRRWVVLCGLGDGGHTYLR